MLMPFWHLGGRSCLRMRDRLGFCADCYGILIRPKGITCCLRASIQLLTLWFSEVTFWRRSLSLLGLHSRPSCGPSGAPTNDDSGTPFCPGAISCGIRLRSSSTGTRCVLGFVLLT